MQYDPIRNRWIENADPVAYLQEHIVRGDRSDGIPNILTCDDAIVTGKTQKKMSKDKIASLASMSPEEFTNFIRLRNWKRNAELIDFTRIPEAVVTRILTAASKTKAKVQHELLLRTNSLTSSRSLSTTIKCAKLPFVMRLF